MRCRATTRLQDFLLRFLAPTLPRNVVGGAALVGLLNHASIGPEMNGRT
jgi:formate/nitrite transporter FocA (FNT family)